MENEIVFEYHEYRGYDHVVTHKGTLALINSKPPYEAAVHTKIYTYNFIYGKYHDGYYFTIPEWFIGCPVSTYKDIEENAKCIEEAGMNACEAYVAATALSNLKKALDQFMKKETDVQKRKTNHDWPLEIRT